jgi:hypothetical protein
LLIATFSEARGNGWGNDPLSSVHVWPLAVLVPDALHADRSGGQTNLNRASVRPPPDHEVVTP